MAVSNPKLVSWFDRKLTYSMEGSRNGTDGTADCSGSITQAIRDAGGVPYDYLYSTVTLHTYLEKNGYCKIAVNQEWNAAQGDIVQMSWGKDMSTSGGAGGHVGVMKDSRVFISVDYWTGGVAGTAVSEHDIDYYLSVQKVPYFEVWRLDASEQTTQHDNPTSYQISKSNKQVQTTDVLNVRSAPTSQSKQVASLPAGKVVTATKICTNGESINGNSIWYEQNSYGWISSAYTQEVAPTRMTKSTSGLISKSGIFTPNRQLSVSGDTNLNETESPALDYAGQTINYDSYIMSNGYAWISYIGGSGNRRYVAVGPDDGRTDTTWGTGFFN